MKFEELVAGTKASTPFDNWKYVKFLMDDEKRKSYIMIIAFMYRKRGYCTYKHCWCENWLYTLQTTSRNWECRRNLLVYNSTVMQIYNSWLVIWFNTLNNWEKKTRKEIFVHRKNQFSEQHNSVGGIYLCHVNLTFDIYPFSENDVFLTLLTGTLASGM